MHRAFDDADKRREIRDSVHDEYTQKVVFDGLERSERVTSSQVDISRKHLQNRYFGIKNAVFADFRQRFRFPPPPV